MEWKPIKSMPVNGEYYLVYSGENDLYSIVSKMRHDNEIIYVTQFGTPYHSSTYSHFCLLTPPQ